MESTYCYCSLIGFHGLRFSFGAYQNLPDIIKGWLLIVIWHSKKRAVPSCHTIWLFVAIDKVFEYIMRITPIIFNILQQLTIDRFALFCRCPYVDLLSRQSPSCPLISLK